MEPMEEIQEILKRIGITTTLIRTADIGPMAENLLMMTGGRSYSPEVLQNYSIDIDAVLKTDRLCPYCAGLDNCKMPSQGWQVIFDGQAADFYGLPMFAARPCRWQKLANNTSAVIGEVAPKFHDQSFETYKRDTPERAEAFETVKNYADYLKDDTSYGLLLIGPSGTGKTHLATAVLRVAQLSGLSIGFVVVPDLLEEFRPNNNSRQLEEKVKSSKVLLMDDLGTEKPSDWVTEQIYRLINYRYVQQLPTLITSNYKVEQLKIKLGENGPKIMDRIIGMCEIVAFKGQSWRRKR